MLILISVQGTCLLMQYRTVRTRLNIYVNSFQSGLEKRYSPVSDELQKRLDYELGVMKKVHGVLWTTSIVWDFIHFAKNNAVMVGPGRGSAAGSIAAYSPGITTVDPIKYGLYF